MVESDGTFVVGELHCFRERGEWFAYDARTCRARSLGPVHRDILELYSSCRPASALGALEERFSSRLVRGAFEELLTAGFIRRVGDLPCQDEGKPGAREGAWPGLERLSLNVVQVCNMNCPYCYAVGGTYGGGPPLMGRDVGIRAVEFLEQHSKGQRQPEIIFFGGEPFLNLPLMQELVRFSRQKFQEKGRNVRFSVLTNGTIWGRQVADWVKGNRIAVSLSLDGPEEINDGLRRFRDGTGTYHRVMNNLNSMARLGIPLNAKVTLTHINTGVFDIYVHLLKLGFTSIKVDPVSMGGPNLDLTPDDVEALCEDYSRIALDLRERWLAGQAIIFWQFQDRVMNLWAGRRNPSACGAGYTLLGVGSDGRLYPCYAFPGMADFCLGDVWEGMNLESVEAFRRLHPVHARRPCMSCWARYICGGECYFHSARRSGGIGEVSGDVCRLYQRMAELAIFLSNSIPEGKRSLVQGLFAMGLVGLLQPARGE